MAFTYILYSEKLDKYYIGATANVEERLIRHNRGAEKFTSTGIPWRLVYKEPLGTIQLAKKREREIKTKKSRKYIESLIRSVQ